jgi:FkbM family methyltransferase
MYFGEEYLRTVENEVYIDAGAYNGDTIKRFLKFCDKKYKKIYAFEPDPNNYKVLEDNIRKERIYNSHLIKKGTWNKSDTLLFSLSGMGSKIKETGVSSVEVVAIDEVVKDDVVTFIKMDIEGAELCSLQGARKTIQRDKPRLAISVYHKREDILTIPLYIHSLVPEYRFFLRHHTTGLDYYDTVLYAVLN